MENNAIVRPESQTDNGSRSSDDALSQLSREMYVCRDLTVVSRKEDCWKNTTAHLPSLELEDPSSARTRIA